MGMGKQWSLLTEALCKATWSKRVNKVSWKKYQIGDTPYEKFITFVVYYKYNTP